MNKYYSTKESLISSIEVSSVEDIRDIFDDAVKYTKISNDGLAYKETNIKRVLVNTIRHNNCDYDHALNRLRRVSIKAKQDTQITYHLYKNATLSAIGKTYPYLEEECARQKYSIQMMKIIKVLEE